MQNFVRKYEFTFFEIPETSGSTNAQNITDLTTQTGFRIKNSINFSFNYTRAVNAFSIASFKFYNLSNESVNFFASKNNRRGFRFYACYDDDAFLPNSLIFQGLTLRVIGPYRVNETDTVTEIIAGDAFFGLLQATISLSYPVSTLAAKIVQDISNYLGVFNMFSGINYLQKKESYSHPLTFNNVPITKILDMIAADNTCFWGYDTTGIKFTPKQNHPEYSKVAITNPILINRNTGLIGNVRPESISVAQYPVDYYQEQRLNHNQPWVTVTSLLRPVSLYSQIKLECEMKELTGNYFLFGYHQEGEYYGGPWFSTLKLAPAGKL